VGLRLFLQWPFEDVDRLTSPPLGKLPPARLEGEAMSVVTELRPRRSSRNREPRHWSENVLTGLLSLPSLRLPDRQTELAAPPRTCADEPETFFPVGATGPAVARQVRHARGLCAGCPVRPQCLALALSEEGRGGSLYGEVGVWGGLTEPERRALVPT